VTRPLIISVIIFLITVISLVLWWYFRPTVRLLQVGDSFTYVDREGHRFIVTVSALDPVTGNLAMDGDSASRRGQTADFFAFRAVVKQRGRWFEILHLALDDPRDQCSLKRGETGRGFLFFPVKWVRARTKSFGFRISCEMEGSFVMRGAASPGAQIRITVPAGKFAVRPVSVSATIGVSSSAVGSADLWVSPELGFPVKILLVAEGRRYELSLVEYKLASNRS
jgi:hypothetical protein